VGDIGVGKRIKGMVESFYGRVAVYEAGLNSEDDSLQAAFDRNIYAEVDPATGVLPALDRYVRALSHALVEQDLAELVAGNVHFAGLEPVIEEKTQESQS
jgi:cytochrome b pre-mRNA-processing protein 3